MHKSWLGHSTALAVAVLIAAACAMMSTSAKAADKVRVLTMLVGQDFSDCLNSDVVAKPGNVGGEGMITRRDDGTTTVNIRLVKVAPNTTYHLFLKCYTLLGNIVTDATGKGDNTFTFRTDTAGPVYAFDMYPDGAPLGNKYQSVQINFQ